MQRSLRESHPFSLVHRLFPRSNETVSYRSRSFVDFFSNLTTEKPFDEYKNRSTDRLWISTCTNASSGSFVRRSRACTFNAIEPTVIERTKLLLLIVLISRSTLFVSQYPRYPVCTRILYIVDILVDTLAYSYSFTIEQRERKRKRVFVYRLDLYGTFEKTLFVDCRINFVQTKSIDRSRGPITPAALLTDLVVQSVMETKIRTRDRFRFDRTKIRSQIFPNKYIYIYIYGARRTHSVNVASV